MPDFADLSVLTLADLSVLTPAVHRFPLAESAATHHALETRGTTGKVVLERYRHAEHITGALLGRAANGRTPGSHA
ncbi:hypothetical protein WKI71_44695 [Streptomyces sp. MS1.AVA.1]|uniref:Uncharacterized protein n=1 Tax=Streptomyces machairae TaxID=3134109 RepID=A0ABU8UVG3_9ACTN